MPSVSARQHRYMEAVAHDAPFAKRVGVPQSVGKEFAAADDKAGITKNPKRNAHMAQRKDAGLTQSEIGQEFGKHRTTVGRALTRGFIKGGSAS